jgi:hypothetical protein
MGVLDATRQENKWSPYGSRSFLDPHMQGLYCKLGGRTGNRNFRWISIRKCELGIRLVGMRRVILSSGILVSGDRRDGIIAARSRGALSVKACLICCWWS